MTVKVTFTYTPDDPDESDPTGMSEEEFIRLTDGVAQLGGEDVQIKKEA